VTTETITAHAVTADTAASDQRKGEVLLLLLTVIWGTTFITTRTALNNITPFMLLGLRFSIGLAVLGVVFFRRLLRITRREVWAGSVLGLVFFLGNALQTSGLKYTSASVSGFLTALSVVIVPGIAFFVLRERLRVGALVGVVLATIGLALLSLTDQLTIGYGDLLTVGCAVAFAFHIVYVTKYAAQAEPVGMVIVQLAIAAVLSFACAALTEPIQPLNMETLFPAFYLGIMATAVAFVGQVYGQRKTTATRAALIYTMEPVFAAFFAYLVAGEMIGPRGLVGCIFILAGMLIAELT